MKPFPPGFATLFFLASMTHSDSHQSSHGRLPFIALDNRTRIALPGAAVCLEGTGKCLDTDSTGTGCFESIEPGLYSIVSWAKGYDTLVRQNIQVVSGLNKIVQIELMKKNNILQLEKKVVVGRKLTQKKPEQIVSVTSINNFELSNTAGTGNDVNRVLAVLPSTVSGMGEGYDNNLYVRGGHTRENVYLVDGIAFDNASHFSSAYESGGAIGFLNSSLVQNLDFYTGGFPARMPSRLSSVIDINLRTGSFQERKHQIDLNMSGIGLTTEGPVFDSHGSYLASIRMVNLRFLKPMLQLSGLPKYGDLQLKTVFTPSDNQTIKLVGIGAFDHFDEYPEIWKFGSKKAEVKYDEYLKQGGGGISWDLGNEKMRNVLGFSGTARYEDMYDQFTNLAEPLQTDTFKFNQTQYQINGKIIDSIVDPGDTLYVQTGKYSKKRIWGNKDRRWQIGLNDDFTVYLGDDNQINTGLFADYSHFYIQNENGYDGESVELYLEDQVTPTVVSGSYRKYTPFVVDSSLAIKHGGAYLEYVFESDMIKAVAGLRGDYYTVICDYGMSPRIGVSLKTGSLGTFSLGGGLYYQFPADFSGLLREIIARNPNWSSTVAPLYKSKLQRNWQAVLGYEKQLGLSHLLTAETYLKWYDHEYPFVSPGQRRYGKYTEDKWVWNLDNPDGEKRAYGLELSIQKKKYDIFYYSLNYSHFRVENKYTDSKWYADEYSLRNMAGVSIGSNFLKHHGVSLRLQTSEGKPYTPAVYDITKNNWMLDTTQEFFSSRLDPIVSLNFRYSFKTFHSWGNIMGYIEIWNVLNYKPVVERYLDSQWGIRDFYAGGILPVAGITVDF